MLHKTIGRSLQTVVYVDGLHLTRPPLDAWQQQRGGIGAAAQGYRQ